MSSDELEGIPPAILKRHPELAAVSATLAAWRAGQPITARCPRCDSLLMITDVEATGDLVVSCEKGHILFRASRKKNSAQAVKKPEHVVEEMSEVASQELDALF
ncbi:MAG: hypothetical protein NZ701_01950 [Roseiflexus sp.]|nr:hypothetical protein [Roseiflexus sp.]